MIEKLVALGVAVVCAACAARLPDPPPFPTTGQAPVIDQPNASVVSGDIENMIAGQLKPTDGPISLGGDNSLIDKDLSVSLKKRGYRIAVRNGKHNVSYVVSPLGPALLIRMRIDDLQAAKLYRAGSAGELLPASPTSVTEG